MKPDIRSKYAEYISKLIRETTAETGLVWPDETIIVTKTYSELAELDEIIGMKIWVMDIPSSYDFFVAFPSDNVDRYKLQKVFREKMDLFDFDLDT